MSPHRKKLTRSPSVLTNITHKHIHPFQHFRCKLSSSNMSTKASLQTKIDTLTATLAERDAKIADLESRIAPAPKAKKERKPKKERDPDAPKKPLSGYMRFCQDKRAETPGAKLKAADLGEMWKLLSDADKAKYKPTDVAPPKPKLAPGEKSAYLKFCDAQRAAHTGDKKLTLKQLGAAWKALSESEQAGYA